MAARHLVLALGFLASFSACGNDDSTGPRPSTIPTGVTWKLNCIGSPSNDTCYDPNLDQPYTIRFEANGTVSGENACNTCGGTYFYVSATQVEIDWTCTEAACGTPPPWLGYGDAVGRTTSFALVDDGLVLTFADQGGEPLQLVHQRAE
ncbi:MAG: hypothetical protein H6Q33_4209 [Deltaproteobacteria bacterium]|nr:hypothetical protein [Deltaproteobacteria bacterium]